MLYHLTQCVIITPPSCPGPPAPPDVLPLLSISAYEAQLQITWTIPFVTYLVVVWSDIDNVSNVRTYIVLIRVHTYVYVHTYIVPA